MMTGFISASPSRSFGWAAEFFSAEATELQGEAISADVAPRWDKCGQPALLDAMLLT